MNNAVKHAQAQRISVNLVFDVRRVQLSVRDDGCGFDTSVRRPMDGPVISD